MNHEEAKHLLGLINGEVLDARKVKAAWARCVKAAHPDTAVGESDSLAVETLTMARDVLINRIAGKENTCKVCSGVGKVRARFGATVCFQCKGTGETP
jgi:DnaJ-class molecular chaperone